MLFVELHHLISQCANAVDLKALGDQLSLEISKFCGENKELFAEGDEAKPASKFVNHQDKPLPVLQAIKKKIRKEAFREGASREKIKLFHEVCKAVSDLKKKQKHKEDLKTGAFQEQKFHKNKYKFAKETVNGTFGKDNINPTFTKQTADKHFLNT